MLVRTFSSPELAGILRLCPALFLELPGAGTSASIAGLQTCAVTAAPILIPTVAGMTRRKLWPVVLLVASFAFFLQLSAADLRATGERRRTEPEYAPGESHLRGPGQSWPESARISAAGIADEADSPGGISSGAANPSGATAFPAAGATTGAESQSVAAAAADAASSIAVR